MVINKLTIRKGYIRNFVVLRATKSPVLVRFHDVPANER